MSLGVNSKRHLKVNGRDRFCLEIQASVLVLRSFTGVSICHIDEAIASRKCQLGSTSTSNTTSRRPFYNIGSK